MNWQRFDNGDRNLCIQDEKNQFKKMGLFFFFSAKTLNECIPTVVQVIFQPITIGTIQKLLFKINFKIPVYNIT